MRREAIAALVVLCVAAGGCSKFTSRLTFIKPKMERKSMGRIAPEYEFKDDPQARARLQAAEQVTLAQQYFDTGNLEQAEAGARNALKADPRSVDANILLGVILQQRGDNAAAGPLYASAVKLAPNNGAALNNYGAWLCGNGKAAESLALFDQAIRAPGYATPDLAYANAGACALKLGDATRARPYLTQAIALNATNATALGAMAEVQLRAGNYLEARAFSERRLAAAPPTVESLQIASQIEDKLGYTAAAADYVRRMNNAFPRSTGTRPMGGE